MGHPRLLPIITVPVPPVVDLPTLLEVIRGELPSLRPISRVFLEDYRVTDAPRATGPVTTITLMRASPPRSRSEAHHVPALDANIDLLERRTALKTHFNQLDGPDGGAMLASMNAFHSASVSVTEDACEHECFSLCISQCY